MKAVKLSAQGNSTGITIPKEQLSRLKLQQGDEIYLSETPNGLMLSVYDPEFEAQMTIARKVMKKRRNALRELAK